MDPSPDSLRTPPLNAPPPPTTPQLPKYFAIIIGAIAAIIIGAIIYATYNYLQASEKPSDPHVKVGVMMAFSGGSSSMGYGAMKGVLLAKKQLGADNLEIIQEDSMCDPKTAIESVKRLAEQRVIAIIGEGCSSASVAARPEANAAKIPLISPSASTPTLSIPNDYFFRVVPPDNLQGAFMAKALYDRGIRNVAIFYTNEPYGMGMNTVFRAKFEELGGKITATAFGEPDVIDLNSQIAQLKSSAPQAVFVAPNSVVTATAVLKLARQTGLNVPFFGADIMYDTNIINNAPAAAEGLIISSFPTGTKSFKQALINEYQKTEQLYAAPQAYDIIHLLQLAVQKGATTAEEVKNALPGLTFQGVSGPIKFDQNGEISDTNYKYDLFEIRDGSFVLLP